MRNLRKVTLLVLGFGLAAGAQPFIDGHTNGHGARSAATYFPPSLPSGGIARGSFFAVFGSGLGPAAGVEVSTYPLQTAFNGVSVSVSQGSTKVAAIPYYVSATQVNLIMPSNAPLGRVLVQLTYNGQSSNVVPATVVAANFGILTINGGGFGPGIFTDYISAASQPVNSLTQTAAPDQVVTMWGTGLGPVPQDNVQASPGDLASQVEVFVGGVSAQVDYHGRSPCCTGLDQIVFTVPANAPQGCYVPVTVRTNGASGTVSNTATMAIAAQTGAPCSDSYNALESAAVAGQSIGAVTADRVDTAVSGIVGGSSEVTTDNAAAAAFSPVTGPSSAFFYNPLISLPPLGTCTTFAADYDMLGTLTVPGELAGGALLDAGPALTIAAGANQQQIAPASLLYGALLGGSDPNSFTSPLFFNPPGGVTVTVPGGAVGGFTARVPTTAPLTWTNRSSLTSVNRGQPLTVNWTTAGQTNSTVVIAGTNFDTPNSASGMFVCTAPASAGTFTVPALEMANLPATGANTALATGFVGLALVPLSSPANFSAANLGTGFGLYTSWLLQSVVWQ